MRIIKLFFLLLAIFCFYLSFDSDYESIGKIWQTYHVNSLIGFQKLIEGLLSYKTWHQIILPILKIKLILIFSIINFCIYIFLKRKT